MTLPKPYLLGLDTSTRQIGLALYDGVQVISEVLWNSLDYHTVELAPAVQDLLAKAGLSVKDLSALGVAIGPGSFTGLRIGLALVKGLALAQKLPVIGIPTLDITAAAQPPQHIPMAAVLQAGRGRLAVGWYRLSGETWQQADQPTEVLTAQDLYDRIESPTLICGELSNDERALLGRKRKNIILATPAQSVRRPSYLAELAWQRWQAGQVDDPAALSPFYLHYSNPIPG